MANSDRNTTGNAGGKPEQYIQHTGPQDIRRPSGGALALNQAAESEIAEIDMIGKKLAQAIVRARSQRGGFRSWEELTQVPGLDAMKLAELQRATRLGD